MGGFLNIRAQEVRAAFHLRPSGIGISPNFGFVPFAPRAASATNEREPPYSGHDGGRAGTGARDPLPSLEAWRVTVQKAQSRHGGNPSTKYPMGRIAHYLLRGAGRTLITG